LTTLLDCEERTYEYYTPIGHIYNNSYHDWLAKNRNSKWLVPGTNENNWVVPGTNEMSAKNKMASCTSDNDYTYIYVNNEGKQVTNTFTCTLKYTKIVKTIIT